MTSVRDRHLRVWYRFPEPDLAIFAFLLNFPWEFRQVSLHADMAQMPHWTAVEACTQAALGDVVIMLNAYWTVCAIVGSRQWLRSASPRQLALFICVGASITVAIELLAVRGLWFATWQYAPGMPLLPGLGVGIAPVLQWLILPPLAVWFVHRLDSGLSPSRG